MNLELISLNDKYPEDDNFDHFDLYLVKSGQGWRIANFYGENDIRKPHFKDYKDNSYIPEVTHWIKLPEM